MSWRITTAGHWLRETLSARKPSNRMKQNERVMKNMARLTRTIGSTALLCGLIVFLVCGVAYAQEQPIPVQTGEQTTPDQQGTGEQTASGQVFFYLNGELAGVDREVAGGGQTAEFGMIELLKGPNEEEKAAGYITYIPEGTKLQYSTIKMDNSEYDVNISGELLQLSGDKDKAAKALAQIEKTLQGLTNIQSIGITIAAEGAGSEPQDAYVALGITKKSGQDAGSSSGGSNTGLIVGIILGVLAVALVALLIFFIPKRREDSESTSATKKTASKKKASK
jgi:hypothetical protein